MLNPETITILDPACGSGHILVEAYDLLKQIYLEAGYRLRDIPRLILEKNLYGLDIDERAAQLAGFALLMKARADDRRLLDNPPQLNILALQQGKVLDADELVRVIVGAGSKPVPTKPAAVRFGDDDLFPSTHPQLSLDELMTADEEVVSGQWSVTGKAVVSEEKADRSYLTTDHSPLITSLTTVFAHAKTFGSLIQIPDELAKALPDMEASLLQALDSGDLFAKSAAEELLPLVRQAKILAMKFDVVVANPPYMGGKFYSAELKKFVDKQYKTAKGDLYTCFMMRNTRFAKTGGSIGMITIPNWMFLSSFEDLRKWLFDEATIETFSHNGRGVFGSDFGSCAFTFRHLALPGYKGRYKRLFDKQGSVASNEELNERYAIAKPFDASTDDFKKIPGSSLAYWLPNIAIKVFSNNKTLGEMSKPKVGMRTGDNARFLRLWHEISKGSFYHNAVDRDDALFSKAKWFPFLKGGDYRKWYGNLEWVVNWKDDGIEIKKNTLTNYPLLSMDNLGWKISNESYYFKTGVTWTAVSSSFLGVRYFEQGCIFGTGGSCIFPESDQICKLTALLVSKVASYFINAVNPTLNINIEDIASIPVLSDEFKVVCTNAEICINNAKSDWNSSETSWDFQRLPWLPPLTDHYYLPVVVEGRNKTAPAGVSGTTAEQKPETVAERPYSGLHPLATDHSPLTTDHYSPATNHCPLSTSWQAWQTHTRTQIQRMQELEEENNRIFIEAYGLQDELSPEVPIEQITLTCNPYYRYKGERGQGLGNSEEQAETGFPNPLSLTPPPSPLPPIPSLQARMRYDAARELISYAIGCMMGRYRLDRPGLIYAHAGNVDFEKIYHGTDVPPIHNNANKSSRHFGRDCRNPEHREVNVGASLEASPTCHPWHLDSGNPCRNDGHFVNSSALTGSAEEDITRDALSHPSTLTPNPFPADNDGILPLTDEHWFEDDAATRITEFLKAVWPEEGIREKGLGASNTSDAALPNPLPLIPNPSSLEWLAESLGQKNNETPQETIRRYLSANFFKDHLQTYKKRPIYWLFSSGKQGAFQALVYLHRYNESTLARMRNQYVIPLTGKIAGRIEFLEQEVANAASTSARTKAQKALDAMRKKQTELIAYDEQLRHYADMRISLDLDDGVKVNYGKFGNLLAEVKAITGGSGDD